MYKKGREGDNAMRLTFQWIRVWRDGFVPLLSGAGLRALQEALLRDDRRLLQSAACLPMPTVAGRDRAVQGACALGWCGWQGDGLQTVGQVESYVERLCRDADAALSEPAACRYFLNWALKRRASAAA
jgi:hypothetical protein